MDAVRLLQHVKENISVSSEGVGLIIDLSIFVFFMSELR